MNTLQELSNLVEELNTTNSSNEKKKILGKYPQCKDILRYIYNPFFQFNVTSKNLKKNNTLSEDINNLDIRELLDFLIERTITGNKAISVINGFIKQNKEYKDIIYNIIDKNLETRTNVSLINSVFPGLIPEFNVALANKYDDYKEKVDFDKDDWYTSRKLDGCRCLVFYDNSGVTCYSRKGKEFEVLDKVKEELLEKFSYLKGHVLDGEICLIDGDGNENFQDIMKEIRRKDHTIQNPMYKVFDILTREEFNSQESNTTFSERLERVDLASFARAKTLSFVEQTHIQNIDHLEILSEEAYSNGWEGLIIRKDTKYKGKRSNDLLKVKKMQDAEYNVIDVVMGSIRHIVDGIDVEDEMLSNIVIEHRGNRVDVGSGFTMEERQEFHKNPDKILGKVITVQYFEETQDKEGKYSLRFPVFKYLHGDKREV